jgi:integrase
LLQADAPITYASSQLGHHDASIALRVYAHWLPESARRERKNFAGSGDECVFLNR